MHPVSIVWQMELLGAMIQSLPRAEETGEGAGLDGGGAQEVWGLVQGNPA